VEITLRIRRVRPHRTHALFAKRAALYSGIRGTKDKLTEYDLQPMREISSGRDEHSSHASASFAGPSIHGRAGVTVDEGAAALRLRQWERLSRRAAARKRDDLNQSGMTEPLEQGQPRARTQSESSPTISPSQQRCRSFGRLAAACWSPTDAWNQIVDGKAE
jgi:hypothetical protein